MRTRAGACRILLWKSMLVWSELNMVERFFRDLTVNRLRRGVYSIAFANASCTTSSCGMSEASAQTTAPSCQKVAVTPLAW